MSSFATQDADVKTTLGKKRPHGTSYRFKKSKKQKEAGKDVAEGSNEEVLLLDVKNLLKNYTLDEKSPVKEEGDSEPTRAATKLPDIYSEIELEISQLSSTGDGLAFDLESKRVYVVPFAVPGDIVLAKIFKHFDKPVPYSITDFVRNIKSSPMRNDSLVKCSYFTTCSGCQFQMLSYSDQLMHKKRIVEKAYQNFSGLDSSLIPHIGDTIGSPLEYGYRTKLTPHFDGPPGSRADKRKGIKLSWDAIPAIGFMKKGTRHTIDIEDCPIGTDAVRRGMKRERKRVTENLGTYQRGATLLLRETTKRISKTISNEQAPPAATEDVILEDHGDYVYEKSCITDSNATATEYINDFKFENPAGSFFQNNNSILPVFTDYIRSHILLPNDSPASKDSPSITHLIDAYSGSGLFTITLSSLFKKSIGIDISPQSIKSATANLRLNQIPSDQAQFIAADATNLFASVTFPAEGTVVIIDPPRKGCSEDFVKQLLEYGPRRVVYVSCNVHTQARDVGMLVDGIEGVKNGEGGYEIESLRGFDFFPQTSHVEGVAVLRRKHEGDEQKVD